MTTEQFKKAQELTNRYNLLLSEKNDVQRILTGFQNDSLSALKELSDYAHCQHMRGESTPEEIKAACISTCEDVLRRIDKSIKDIKIEFSAL